MAAVKATIAGFESEFKANDLALDKEKIELTNSKLESEDNLSIERKRMNAEQIQDDMARLLRQQEIDEQEQELHINRLQRVIDEAGEGTQAKVDAQIALDEFMSESDRTNLERKTEIAEAEKALEEQKRAQKEETLNAIISIAGAESKLGKVAFIAKMALQLKEQIMDAKALILKAKNAMIEAQLKGSNAGVEITGSVAKGANTAPPPFNVPFILAAITTGIGIIATVKAAINATKQVSSKVGAAASGGGEIQSPQAAISSVSAASASPPDLTSVGGSSATQIADAIGQQNQTPIQTYVVASDVTTAQSLDRNIIDGASL